MNDARTMPSFNHITGWLSDSPSRLFFIGVSVALLVAAGVMVWLMEPPLAELAALVRTLAITAVLSLGLGFVIYRRGLARSPSLTLTLALAYGWAGLLTLVNVLVLAELMFVSPHDLALAIVLLVFAAIIATTFGVFVAASLTDGLRQLAATARRVAAGDLGARAEVNGRDEVAQAATAFNEMAAQLQTAAEQRAEVEQLRRDLIAWISHDLRTPLTSVRAMVEALHDGVVEDEETVQRYYRTIRADIVALNDLIDDLFEMAQLDAHSQPLQVAPHALSDLISDAVSSFQALAEQESVTISQEVDAAVDPVPLDAVKVGRVLNNLIANGLQHTPRGGEITITAACASSDIHVTVADTGPGFAEESLPRVFEQFYRGEQARPRATGGAGLGLAIAHAIVEAHGGRMWAENLPQGGACVGFSLPA